MIISQLSEYGKRVWPIKKNPSKGGLIPFLFLSPFFFPLPLFSCGHAPLMHAKKTFPLKMFITIVPASVYDIICIICDQWQFIHHELEWKSLKNEMNIH